MNKQSPQRRILFVDDDPEFLQMVDRLMRLWSKNNLEILTAQSASAALGILQDQALDLVVVDVCMPVVDGLQFLSIVNRRFPGLQKVVLTGFATEAYRAACLSNGAELFLEKPRTSDGMESIFATLNELARWKPEPGFRGVLRRVGLIDIIQMECLGRSSSLLSVVAEKTTGNIFIKEGFIIHAESGGLKGEEAFKHLLSLPGGDFRLNAYAEPSEQTISGSWEGLLMDAAQSRDEIQETGTQDDAVALGVPDEEEAPIVDEEAAALPVKIQELMICSEAGDVFHSWQCANTHLRINFLEFLSQKARLLVNVLPLGRFDRAEFSGAGTRLIAQVNAGNGIVLRTSAGEGTGDDEGLLPKTRLSVPPSADKKARTLTWFETHIELAGLLAATLQFSDRSGSTHSLSSKFQTDSLESLKRCMTDGFQVLRLQRFSAHRARWIYDETAIEAAQWRNGTTVALVLSRQALDLNRDLIERRIQEFMEEEET